MKSVGRFDGCLMMKWWLGEAVCMSLDGSSKVVG